MSACRTPRPQLPLDTPWQSPARKLPESRCPRRGVRRPVRPINTLDLERHTLNLGGGPMSDIESARRGQIRRRVMPSLVTFIVAAGALYLTAWVALGVLRHVVMPIVAVVIAGYLAVQVYRFTGRDR